MENNNNGMDRAFREAASNYEIPLSQEEKGAIWKEVRRRNRRPVFWAWIGAGGAVLLLGAFLLYQFPEASFTQGEISEKVASESTDEVERYRSEKEPEYSVDADSDEALTPYGPEDGAADDLSAEVEQRHEDTDQPGRGGSPLTQEIQSTDGDVSAVDEGEEIPSEIPAASDSRTEWEDQLHELSGGLSELLSGMPLKERESALPSILEDEVSEPTPHADYLHGELTPLTLSDPALHALTKFDWEEFSTTQISEEGVAGAGFIDLYFNADIVSNRFRATSPAGQRLKDGYRDYTGPWFSFSTGAMTNLKTLGNFRLLAGLEYQRITREFDFRRQGVEYNMKYSPEAYYFIDDSGEMVWVDGAVLTPVSSEQRLRAPNVHEFVRIPVLVEYMKEHGNLKLGLSMGVAVNVFENHSGYLMVDEDQYRSVESGDYERRWFSDVRVNFLAGYRLTDQWSIYGRAGYQGHAGDWLSTGQDLEMSVTVLSLGMGVRRSF